MGKTAPVVPEATPRADVLGVCMSVLAVLLFFCYLSACHSMGIVQQELSECHHQRARNDADHHYTHVTYRRQNQALQVRLEQYESALAHLFASVPHNSTEPAT